MGRLGERVRGGERKREREKERQTGRQMSNRGLLSLEQKADLGQTSKLHISPLTGRVRLSVSSPSPFAGPWHPFTLGSTGSTPPSAPPPPFSPSPLFGQGGQRVESFNTHSALGRRKRNSCCDIPAQLHLTAPDMSFLFVFPRSDHQRC